MKSMVLIRQAKKDLQQEYPQCKSLMEREAFSWLTERVHAFDSEKELAKKPRSPV